MKSAIGFDEKRGDHVEVVSMRFTNEDSSPVADSAGLLGLNLDKADLLHLAQTALFGVIGVLDAAGRAASDGAAHDAVAPAALAGGGAALASLAGPAGAALQALQVPAAASPATATGAAGTLPLLEDESMVNIAQIEGQMRASSLRRIGELVEKHPDETLSIVRGWMVQENS